MKHLFFTISIFVILGNKAIAACNFNKLDYNLTSEKYFLSVEKNDYISNKRNYECYAMSDNFEAANSTFYKCSDKIILSKTKYSFRGKNQITWVLIDQNENTFLLNETEFSQGVNYKTVRDSCLRIDHESNSRFVFDKTVNYSGDVYFTLKTISHYESKKLNRPMPEF